MLHRVNLLSAILTIALLTHCEPIHAEIAAEHPVDYHYIYTSPVGGSDPWTAHEDPGYGKPEWWITTPGGDIILHVPNNPQPDKYKLFWLQIDWSELPTTFPEPQLTTEQEILITGGNHTPNPGDSGFTWQWELRPQPAWENINFGSAFPWANVTNIEVASRCVPEPSSLVLSLIGAGVLGCVWWRKRKN